MNLRNDGSIERINERFGDNFAQRFNVIPDNGFHYKEIEIAPYVFEDNKQTIGVCLSNDSFTHIEGYEARKETLNREIACFLNQLIKEDCRIVLLPHMPKDLEAIHALYRLLGEKAFRYSVVIAPYNNLDKLSVSNLISYYKACSFVLATRFHSSIIPIICKIPATGLAAESLICPERILALYKCLGLHEFSLEIPMEIENIRDLLYRQYCFTMDNKQRYESIVEEAMKTISEERKAYFANIGEFIELHR